MFAACTAECSQAEQIKSALPDAAAPPSSHASHSMMRPHVNSSAVKRIAESVSLGTSNRTMWPFTRNA